MDKIKSMFFEECLKYDKINYYKEVTDFCSFDDGLDLYIYCFLIKYLDKAILVKRKDYKKLIKIIESPAFFTFLDCFKGQKIDDFDNAIKTTSLCYDEILEKKLEDADNRLRENDTLSNEIKKDQVKLLEKMWLKERAELFEIIK